MRPFHAVVGLVALGLGLAGWATMGQAQPKPSRPVKAEIPSPRPKPVDDPFVDPPATQVPIIRARKPDPEPATEPVRVLDKDPVETPDLPPPPGKPPASREAPRPAVKPVAAAIPEPEDPKLAGPAARQEPAVSLEWFG